LPLINEEEEFEQEKFVEEQIEEEKIIEEDGVDDSCGMIFEVVESPKSNLNKKNLTLQLSPDQNKGKSTNFATFNTPQSKAMKSKNNPFSNEIIDVAYQTPNNRLAET